MPIPLVLSTPQALLELVGKEVGVTDWFVLSQERIRQFADATEDRQWIHLDLERAERESPYGTTVAHGFLTLSLLSRFLKEVIQLRSGVSLAINYGLNRVRFPSPVPAGSKICARFTLQSAKEVGEAIEAVYLAKVEVQGASKPCCVAEWIVRYQLEPTPGKA